MGGSNLVYLAQQIAYQSPTLLVAFLAVGLSLFFFRRYRIPALLTLVAAVIIVISSFAIIGVQVYYFSGRYAFTMRSETYASVQLAIGWFNSLSRGLALLLLVIAVFFGRKQTDPVVRST